MKKNSLNYSRDDSRVEQYLNGLNPKILKLEQNKFLKHLHGKGISLLPPWLFVEAVEQSPMAISITDKKANILYVNQAFTDVTGYKMDEMVGQNESLLSFKATPRHIYHNLWYTISRNKVWNGQLINRHKNGEPYLAELTVAPMQDSLNNITHYLGIHRDISEQHQNEKKSHNQKLLIESMINATSVAMVVLDQNNKVILDNQVYKALISDLDHKEPAYLFLELISKELTDIRSYLKIHPEGFHNVEIRLDVSKKSTPLWYSCSGKIFQEKCTDAGSFFDEATQDYLLLSISDTTRQRLLQESLYLQSIKDMLAEEEQIRSIRETLLGAIHQVSQPLNQIQAAIQLIRQKNQPGALLDLLIQLEISCQKSVNTMQSCVPEIIPGAIKAINLNQILHEVLQLTNPLFLRNGILVEWKPTTILPKMLGSENKLRMLFKQLINNAVNAFCNSQKSERLLEITTFSNTQHLFVSITDNGPGIPSELRSKVFQPFFTTQKWGGAQAGMGLVMAKEITNQLNGSIEIDPEHTNGCRFVVSFPISSPEDYDRFDP
jgi:nitrogen fixation regulatory protein